MDPKKQNKLAGIIVTICICLFAFSVVNLNAQELIITHKQVRTDEYNLSDREIPWSEGWAEMQFFPRYFKPACALHLFLKNTSQREINVDGLLFNGNRIEEVSTRPDYVGPVIWYRTNMETIPPNGTAMVYVRMREPLSEKVTLGVKYDNSKLVSAEISEDDISKMRIASTGYDLKQQKLFVFVEKHSPERMSLKRIFIDGEEITESDYTLLNRDFDQDKPAFIEINLKPDVQFGQLIILKVENRAGHSTAYQLRVRDNKIDLGVVYGPAEKYPLYRKYFFNSNYILGHGGAKIPEGFWEGADENEISMVQTASRKEDILRVLEKAPTERFTFGTIDEPDGNDWGYKQIALMDRCGINIMEIIEPILARVRKYAPLYQTSILVDRTYAPSNWYIYGEIADLFYNDIYSLYFKAASDAFEVVAPTVSTAINAAAPRPYNAVLWGCMGTNKFRRAYTPLENDMEVHYAIGSGAKGITYFLETAGVVWSSGRYYVGASMIKPLWNSIGKLNAKITRIASLLNAGHPVNIVEGSNAAELWVESLQCGKDSFVVVAVNKNYILHANDQLRIPHIFPVEDETITVTLPKWLKRVKVVEVSWDKVTELKVKERDGQLIIPVKNMLASRVYVISSDKNIEQRLGLDQDKLEALIAADTAAPRTGETIKYLDLKQGPVELSQEQLTTKSYRLNFGKLQDLEKANKLNLEAAELDIIPEKGLALYPLDLALESRAELTYCFESAVPLQNIKVSLSGTTPDFVYCANNTIGISSDGVQYASDCSFKPEWDGGFTGKKLAVQMDGPVQKFYVKISMKDPQIMWTGEYSNTIENVTVSWNTGN